jgi:cell division protein FtsQ
MKKTYIIILLVACLILLSTFSRTSLNSIKIKKNYFFKVKNIEIVNTSLIKEEEIKKRLSYIEGKNIINLKKREIRNSLLGINFLKDIEVKKKYPNTIFIKVKETIPLAIIIKKEKKYLIDSESRLIPFDMNITSFKNLPNIFGEGAENYFKDFLQNLKKNNFPYKKIKNYFYYQSGRWDIRLLNDKTIKFPINNVTESIKESIELLKRPDFADYNIIDLRVSGGVIVE